jgi:teichuronic acid biosynthesis glycosyltransferase TuaC
MGTWLSEQVRGLRMAGVDVDVLVIDPRRTRLEYGLKLAPLIRTLRSTKYDIVHTHHTYSLLVVELARKLARCAAPVVLTNHESEAMDTGRRTGTWHPTSRLRHSLALKRLAARRADFVILACSQLTTVLTPGVRHEVIPCGVDMDKFRPLDRLGCRKYLGLPREAKVIFFPSKPTTSCKGFSLARATYDIVRRHLPDAMLVTAGSISHGDMPMYFNAADVVLQTSLREASPTVVKEALACEVPVVSTDAGDTREVVEGVPYCFVCSYDPSELANGLLRSIGRRAAGGRDRLYALGLSLDQVTARVIRVYRRLCDAGETGITPATPGLHSGEELMRALVDSGFGAERGAKAREDA